MKKKLLVDILYDIFGGLIFGAGIVCFFNSCNIAPGGVSGVSIMLNYLFGAPIGLSGFLINIPIIVLGFIYLGKKMMSKTLKSIIITSVIIDVIITPFFPVYTEDRLLASIFGGVLIGIGLGAVFMRGSTTGGTDVLSYLIKLRYPHFSIGRAIMLIDCVVLVVSAVVFENFESAMYGLVGLFCSTKVIDGIIYGADRGTVIFVISQKNKEISEYINMKMERGATLIQSRGIYSGRGNDILMCAVRRNEYAKLKATIEKIDKNAFFIAAPAEDISGEGFKHLP